MPCAPHRPRRPPRHLLGCRLLLAVLALGLSGCLEVVERWTLDDKGGGRLDLTVLHDASLLRQVRSAAGERALIACGSREVPLSAEVWRELLAGAPGIEVVALEEGIETGGWHRLHLELTFASLADVARLEPLRGRALVLEGPPDGSEGDARRARFEVDPFRRVPLVDPYLALAAAGPVPPDAPSTPFEDGWLTRLGVPADRAALLGDLLEARLGGVRLACEVRVPGAIREEGGHRGSGTRQARIVLDREALQDPTRDRALRIVWRAGELDRFVPYRDPGDAPRPRLVVEDATRVR